jgi:hypothetical protein
MRIAKAELATPKQRSKSKDRDGKVIKTSDGEQRWRRLDRHPEHQIGHRFHVGGNGDWFCRSLPTT